MTEFINPAVTAQQQVEVCTPSFWHPLFSKHLLKSRFIPLHADFLHYLLADGLVLPKGTHIHGVGDGQLSDDEDVTEAVTTAPEAPCFPDLVDSIERAIAELGGKVFVKLNWMSAHDAVWVNGGTAVCHTVGDVCLLLKASDKVSSAAETLLSCSSEHAAPTLSIVKWANFFPSMEFRCFVKDKRLVGLCQRNCSTHFEFLDREMEWVEDVVVKVFHSAVRDTFPLESYVYDIYIDKQRRLWLVDFNVFGAPTSPLLFEWTDFDGNNQVVEELDGTNNSEDDDMDRDLMVRTVQCSDDLLPHMAGQSRGPTDVIDHQQQVSSVLKMSLAQLQSMQGDDSSDDSDEDNIQQRC